VIPAQDAPRLWLRGAPVGTQLGANSSPADDASGHAAAIMAIINRTDDSFYAAARSLDDSAALRAAETALADGAQIVDIGGVRAGVGPVITQDEEIRRVVPFVRLVRERFPELLISVDTWRSGVAREVAAAGADLINDTWAGHDPELVHVAGEFGIGVVCSHTGNMVPRTDPFRVTYIGAHDHDGGSSLSNGQLELRGDRAALPGILDDVLATLQGAAARAVAAGVDPRSVLVDPTHDFGKNTWHSLQLMRHTSKLVELGFPVLMALSRKDFVGETLDLAPEDRLEGTLAATAVAAWEGAQVFRAHDVRATRRVLDMVAAMRGELAPKRVTRAVD